MLASMIEKIDTPILNKREQAELQAQFNNLDNPEQALEQPVRVKLFHPILNWIWYLISQDPQKTNCFWGITKKNNNITVGPIRLSEIETLEFAGVKVEKDLFFRPVSGKLVLTCLKLGGQL